MKIAIHQIEGNFSDRWITYCKENKIPYKVVNCYNSDIIEQIKDCDVLMWHFYHLNYKDMLFAKQLLFSLEQSGKKVFPNFNTAWHFDDKLGQKYLLEVISAPIAPSYVYYDEQDALNWIEKTSFPKVFKLRGGAGSQNVKLIRSKGQAKKMIKNAFGKGFPLVDPWNYLKELKYKNQTSLSFLVDVLRGLKRGLFPNKAQYQFQNERGYVYFQDFIPNNDSDIRVIVIGNKAFAIKRKVRQNDFRASGSGVISYSKEEIDERCISLAFKLTQKLNTQCTAYDFIFNDKNEPMVVELSYGFTSLGYDPCPGYWDSRLRWHEGPFNPYGWMVETVLDEINKMNSDPNRTNYD